jgi:hypothetical protein
VSLLWAVPVVVAAVATLVVVARARTLEDDVIGLVDDVRDLRLVREPLAAVRAMAEETDALVVGFRDRHPFDDEGRDGRRGAGPQTEGDGDRDGA